ncbi:MAG: hypothetical protein K6G24_03715 [Lachnospiraceae bacterium]|nr:hypothetical protein [Lachnospiraceae bacterium]
MFYIDSIVEAVKQVCHADFTAGNLMITGGCLLLLAGLLELLTSFGAFKKQRERMFKQLRDDR